MIVYVTVDGNMACELAKICRQQLRLFRRYGFPGFLVGVVYAFLRILIGIQDIAGDIVAVSAIFSAPPLLKNL